MEKLFGLDMTVIAGCLGSMLALVILGLIVIAWRQPVMFKLGLRPIPRRRAQSGLIVGGLMLATLIITAAFGTGDTLSHTIRSLTIEGLGEIDEIVGPSSGNESYFKLAMYDELGAQLNGFELVDAFVPAISETVPAVNLTSRKSLRALEIRAFRPEDAGVLLRDEMSDEAGQLFSFNELGPRQIYLNAEAAAQMGASVGDSIDLYAGAQPKNFTVRDIAAGGDEARVFMTLRQAQSLFGQAGRINQILVSNKGDERTGAVVSPQVTAHLRGLLTDQRTASQIFSLLGRDGTAATLIREDAATLTGNAQTDLVALADGLDRGELTLEFRSLLADETLANRVVSILKQRDWRSETSRDRLELLFGDLSELSVNDIKRDSLDQGELAASAFTTIFVVTGLFGIAAGLVLIFLIFVMLATERKPEMGMARAVGAQRGHLIQMFVFEGTAYDLAAAAVGLALGVGVGVVIALTLGQAFSSADIEIRPSISWRSLVVSYSLGMLVTFATVLISANRVSRLNIVAAVRDLPEPPAPPRRLRDWLMAPIHVLAEGFRRLRRWQIGRALWTWIVRTPLSLFGVLWAGFLAGPLTLLLGLALTAIGLQSKLAAPFTLGGSFTIIGLCLMLRGLFGLLLKNRPGAASRLSYTLLGLSLMVYWALPSNAFEVFGVKDLKSGPEMLFVSGIMLVAGAVLVVMHNADILLRGILLLLGGSRRLAPVVRMAVAYPLASTFRTGMTIAMFAVVMFSVVFMATLFQTNEDFFANTDALTGGFELRAETSANNPLENLASDIGRNPRLVRSDYAVVASQSHLNAEVRQGDGSWGGYPVVGVDAAYAENSLFTMAVMAEGYTTAQEVWRAVRDHPGYAVVDALAVPSRERTTFIIGGPEFRLDGVFIEDPSMKPIAIEARELSTQARIELTVIGVLEQTGTFGFGIYTSQETLERALPAAPPATTHFIRLAPGVDPGDAGAALESAFLKYGLQSIDQVEELDQQQAAQQAIQQLLLGFLTLGLVVGVAALGVISTRAVVERRQQIGMLRALGFQRDMVAWAFLIESSFVALLGILLGASLAILPAYQVVQDIAADIPGMRFHVPWGTMAMVMGLAYGAALLTTWLPSRQAARVTPAEALRYE